MNNNGIDYIHKLMHAFIEGCAAGVYTSVEDVQCDASEYLAMEKAVDKLSNWNESSSVEELAQIFDGMAKSLAKRKENQKKEDEWQSIQEMPKVDLNGMQEHLNTLFDQNK